MTSPTLLIANQAFCGAGGLATIDASTTAGGKTICCKFLHSQVMSKSNLIYAVAAKLKG